MTSAPPQKKATNFLCEAGATFDFKRMVSSFLTHNCFG